MKLAELQCFFPCHLHTCQFTTPDLTPKRQICTFFVFPGSTRLGLLTCCQQAEWQSKRSSPSSVSGRPLLPGMSRQGQPFPLFAAPIGFWSTRLAFFLLPLFLSGPVHHVLGYCPGTSSLCPPRMHVLVPPMHTFPAPLSRFRGAEGTNVGPDRSQWIVGRCLATMRRASGRKPRRCQSVGGGDSRIRLNFEMKTGRSGRFHPHNGNQRWENHGTMVHPQMQVLGT